MNKQLRLDIIPTILLFGIIFLTLFWTMGAAQAESKSAKGDKKTTTINFDDELVEGEVKKPELLYLLQKTQFNFKRLIKLRENFLPEMNRTAEDIERAGGEN